MAISKEQRAELVRKGAVETTVQDFLDLDEADMKIVEFRVRLAKEVRRRRLAARITQKALAERMKVSQPRIPEIESGTTSSLESVMLAFFATGGSLAELAEVVASGG
jgi:DNA-binding XRE family transcriptional regulator